MPARVLRALASLAVLLLAPLGAGARAEDYSVAPEPAWVLPGGPLPEQWEIAPEQVTVEDPAFRFTKTLRYSDGSAVVDYRYQRLTDHVPRDRYEAYVRKVRKAREALGLGLYSQVPAAAAGPAAPADGVHGRMVYVAFCLAVGAGILALPVYRYDPPPLAGEVVEGLQGFGGWLLLPTIGLVLAPVRLLRDMGEATAVFDAAAWASLTTPGEPAYHALWAPLLVGELTCNIALLVLTLVLLLLYFQRRSSLPRLFVAWMAFSLAINVADLLVAGQIPAAAAQIPTREWTRLGGGAMVSALWAGYFLGSRRVRATFVRRWRGPAAAPSRAALEAS